MIGTFPRFYKIKITEELDQGVRFAHYPAMKTVIERHTPRVPRRRSDGMRSLDNRVKILQCYEAFMKVVHQQQG